jgi:hypothetical protein
MSKSFFMHVTPRVTSELKHANSPSKHYSTVDLNIFTILIARFKINITWWNEKPFLELILFVWWLWVDWKEMKGHLCQVIICDKKNRINFVVVVVVPFKWMKHSSSDNWVIGNRKIRCFINSFSSPNLKLWSHNIFPQK